VSGAGRTGRRGAARLLALGLIAATGLGLGACVTKGELSGETFRLKVGLTLADGSPLPGPADPPLCLDLRGLNPNCHDARLLDKDCPSGATFLLSVEAIKPTGARDTSFNDYTRASILPGTVLKVLGDHSDGRNIRLENGYVEGQKVCVTGSFGPTHIIIEDLGYKPGDPTDPAKPPACADGKDNDGDGLVDFPADPGCAFSNDDSETDGTFASGASPTISYLYPLVAEAQGFASGTPFAEEGVVIETSAPRATVIVNRVSSGGFYVTDVDVVTDDKGNQVAKARDYGSLYVFNFGPPDGLNTCDRLTYLSGTMDEFFGYTEMNFPSFNVHPWDFRSKDKGGDGPCLIPEPTELTGLQLSTDSVIEKVEAGLVRVRGAKVAAHFGPDKPTILTGPEAAVPASFPCQPLPGATPKKFVFTPTGSNCDFDGSGSVDFTAGSDEALCSCFCFQDADCSEYSEYQGRSTFRVSVANDPNQTIKVNGGSIQGFDPRALRGKVLGSVTGTASNFSGGSLNWTIEMRCSDDLVACTTPDADCAAAPPEGKSSQVACPGTRISIDNESGSN
jgi:hypothetical protein